MVSFQVASPYSFFLGSFARNAEGAWGKVEQNVSTFERLLTLLEKEPLSRSMPATLLVATSISDDVWVSWIKLELMGYFADNSAMKEDTVVPEYRGVPGQWYDDYRRALVLNDPGLSFINELRLRQGVTELEGIAAGTGTLAMRPTEFSEIIRNKLKVEVSIFRFHPSSVSQVLTNIKVRLLDSVASHGEKIRAFPDIQVPQQGEILELKPSLYGMSIDLKALWRRVFGPKK
jgi:AbiTii